MPTPLQHIDACVFDAYGTLFDVHAAVAVHRNRAGPRADELSALWRTRQLEYTWLRSLMGRHADFWQVTRDALRFACASVGLHDNELCEDLMQAYLTLAVYPDVAGCLQALRARGIKRAILSNGTPRMLASAVERSGLTALFDAVLSVESVGIFKPAPAVYQLAVDALHVPAEQILFMSSNAWDAAAAKSFGMRVAWINRTGLPREELGYEADVELKSLVELAGVIE